MKHVDELSRLAQSSLEQLGVHIADPGALSTCIDHLLWVLEVSRNMNLTSVVDPEEALRVHLVDSLAALPEIGAAPSEGRMVDIGTGGGFPGLPLAVVSGRNAVLLDSVAKKAAAVGDFVAARGIGNVEMFAGRSEAFAAEAGPTASVVVARAVAELSVLVELAAPLLHIGGHLVALKGRPQDLERSRGAAAALLVGMELVSERSYCLPGGGEDRSVLVFRKVGPASLELPRRPGMAKKRPLA